MGSTRALTNSSGDLANTDTFDPYGNVTASSGSVANAMLFSGQYMDTESGLYYLQARYYDPGLAQFLSVDPLVEETQTPYAYAVEDPINNVDLSGNDVTQVVMCERDKLACGLPPGEDFTGSFGICLSGGFLA